jgi:phosphate-selective porin OprO/OprP
MNRMMRIPGSDQMRNGRGLVHLLSLIAMLLGPSLPVTAQDASSSPRQAAADTTAASGWQYQWDAHPSLRYGDAVKIDFLAAVQADGRKSEAPVGEAGGFTLARRRVGLIGGVDNLVDVHIELELREHNLWRDVYANYRQFAFAQFQAGKFKLPFSLDENTSPTDLDFVYRSLAARQLAPGRDRGAMVHGHLLKSIVGYELGVFNHDGRHARTTDPDAPLSARTTAGRLSIEPFSRSSSVFRTLHAAAAFTRGDIAEGMSGLRGRTVFDHSFFESDVWIQGRRSRTGFEAQWKPGPFSLTGEYIRVATERLGEAVDNSDLSPLVARGWYVSGTWAITGQSKAGNLARPERSIRQGGPGVIELALRLETLKFSSGGSDELPSSSPRSDAVFANRDRVVTTGVNWYPLRHIKLQGNLIHEDLAMPDLGPLPEQPSFWSGVLRLQLSL